MSRLYELGGPITPPVQPQSAEFLDSIRYSIGPEATARVIGVDGKDVFSQVNRVPVPAPKFMAIQIDGHVKRFQLTEINKWNDLGRPKTDVIYREIPKGASIYDAG